MSNFTDPDQLVGRDVVTTDGDKVGSVGQVYVDDQSGQLEWVTVRTGVFGTSESFVPLREGKDHDGNIAVPYTKDQIKDAPRGDHDGDGHLSEEGEAELYRYYSITPLSDGTDTYADTRSDTYDTGTAVRPSADLSDRTEGHDVSGPTTDNAMTRSEEQLRVGTQKVEAGRARLRKHVVTENVSTTVPVTSEKLVVEREPITDANRGAAMSGPDISEEEHEIVLTEERPVVSTETVAVERVKIGTETVTTDEQVTGEVRKEQIDVADNVDTDRNR